jgi:cysteine-rich repeat protein
LPERCGDGIVQEGEACDDGNEDESDACVRCELARCGDGLLRDDEEQCDDGNAENDDDCVEGCTPARCGDGFVHAAAEECDDGADNGDTRACTSACAAAQCGDGLVFEGAEECDDANDVATDGCGACVFAVTRLVAGEAFTCAVLGDGSLRCWGRNDSGQLGLGDLENRGDQPGELGGNLPSSSFDHPVSDLALGARHACAISDGVVYCWGDGTSGALGQGNESMKTAPARVDIGPGTPAAVAAGEGFSCVMLDDGAVRCWGAGAALGAGSGAIGDEPDEMGENLKNAPLSDFGEATQIAARRQHVCALLDTQRVACWGGGQSSPKQAKPIRVQSIAVGSEHWCVLNHRRDVQCWGAGGLGQLGNDEAMDRTDAQLADAKLPSPGVIDGLSIGDSFTCALAEGKAYCWGQAGPQLGQPAYAEAGHNLGDESGEMSTMEPVALGRDAVVQSLTAGLDHVCALLTSGAVKCWGANDSGQLGLGDTVPRGRTIDEIGDALPEVSLH